MKGASRFSRCRQWSSALPVLVAHISLFSWFACGSAAAAQQDTVPAENPIFPAYRLDPEDQLKISVWQDADLKEDEILVRPDGKLSFPLAGEIDAAGMTPGELQAEIAKRLQKYIPDAVVTVLVEKVAGYKIYVIGQVKSPGQYQVGHYVDVMQALALAGGLTPFAASNSIKILRRDARGVQRAIPFEYARVARGEGLKQNIILKTGDMVVVP